MDAPGEMIDIGGRRLHLLRRGQGVPAVILESGGGGGSSTQDWPLLGRVARFTHALSYDRAGLGWSDPAPAPKTFNGMAGDLDALLVAAGESPPFWSADRSAGSWCWPSAGGSRPRSPARSSSTPLTRKILPDHAPHVGGP